MAARLRDHGRIQHLREGREADPEAVEEEPSAVRLGDDGNAPGSGMAMGRTVLGALSGEASEGTVDALLARSAANRKKIAIVGARDEGGRGKRAVTHWTRLEFLRDAALVECRLETGRTHQVRVHMSAIGHPLLGDPVYGRTRTVHRELLKILNFKRQALHAAELGFIHPVSKENLSFKSAVPSDMQELFRALTV